MTNSLFAQPCPTLCDPMDCRTPGFPVPHHLPQFAQTHVHELVKPFNHFIPCHPLLLMPSVFPSIRVFPNRSALHIRWPKYWGFSFSIGSSSEYSRLISFRIDWFDFLAVRLSKVFSSTTVQMHQFFSIQPSLWSNSHIICTHLL